MSARIRTRAPALITKVQNSEKSKRVTLSIPLRNPPASVARNSEIRSCSFRDLRNSADNLPQFGAAHSPYSSSRGRCCQEVSKRGGAFAEQGRPVGHPIFGSMLRYAKGALTQRKRRDRLRNAVPRVLRRRVLTRNFPFCPSRRRP